MPSNRLVFELDALSPLAWFQMIWPRLRGDADITSEDTLGVAGLYGFLGFADSVRTKALQAPTNYDELQQLLSQYWYSGNVESRDGYVLIETDDDEVELAFWWVSDEVFHAQQEQFACYATDSLPGGTGAGDFDPQCEVAHIAGPAEEGAVFGVFVTVWDGGNLSDLPGPVRISGLRLPNLTGWLRTVPGNPDGLLEIDWLALVARHNPDLDLPSLLRRLAEVSPDSASWHYKEIHTGAITEDTLRTNVRWLGERERTVTVQGDDHHIELRFEDGFNYHVWFLFDDLWASAHPVLARSLLYFGLPIS